MFSARKPLAVLVAAALAVTFAFSAVGPNQAHAADKKNKWLAAGLNFFIPGAGYLYNGKKPLYVSLPMMAGAVGFTYVEQVHKFPGGNTLQKHDSTAFAALFAAVLLVNTGTAIDAWQEADAINSAADKDSSSLDLHLSPTASLDGDRVGLAISGSF